MIILLVKYIVTFAYLCIQVIYLTLLFIFNKVSVRYQVYSITHNSIDIF